MDIMGMMKKAQAMQAKLQEAQDELGRLEVEGPSGGGMVRVTLTAKGEMKGVAHRSVAADAGRQGDARRPDHRRLRRRQGQGRSRGGGEDAGAGRRPAAAARHETAVLRPMSSNVAGPEIERLDSAAGASAGARAALGAPGGAAPHPQARDAARPARRGDAGRAGADRRPARSAATSIRATPARSARTSGATRDHRRRRNRSAISGRSSARGATHARYHVLGGALSPLDGVGPADLNLAGLVARVAEGGVSEVILAVNATVDGQTTAHYIIDLLRRFRQGDAPCARRAGRRRTRLSRRRHARRGDAPADGVLAQSKQRESRVAPLRQSRAS